VSAAHSLAIRIVDLDDGAGTTIALIDFPVSPAISAPDMPETEAVGILPDRSAEILSLRDELATVRAQHAARESEFLEAHQQAQRTATEIAKREIDTELAVAQAIWKSEADKHIAAEIERNRDLWAAEQTNCVIAAKERAQEKLREACERWQADSEIRFAAAQAQWQQQSAIALAEARAETEATCGQSQELELRRLREELAALHIALADRDAAVEHARRAARDGLSKAEQAWRADGIARFAAAETQWQQKSAKALAEAQAHVEAVRNRYDETEHRLRDELAALQETLSARESAMKQAALDARQAQERRQYETQNALSQAEETRRNEESARAAGEHQNDGELRRLRDECAILQQALADGARALAQMRLASEEARTGRQQELTVALSNAQKTWKTEMAEQLSKAEAQWHKQSEKALTQMTARFNAAEAALKQARAGAGATRDRGDDIEVRRLRDEISVLQASLANRETELAQRRLPAKPPHEHPGPETKISLRRNRTWNSTELSEQQRRARSKRRAIGGGAVAAALAAAGILFYSGNGFPAMESVRSNVTTMTARIGAMLATAPAMIASASLPQPAAPQPSSVVLHNANLRSGPLAAASIVSTLHRGLKVAAIEQRGNWTLVRIDSESGKLPSKRGWVFSSFLSNADTGTPENPGSKH
jgi:hypothetical protein